jgi:hypothetical protein
MKIKRNSKSFDITKYSIQFTSIFEFKEIQNSFHSFLLSEFNTEPLDCILEINKLPTLKSDREIIEKCKYIIETYLQDTSKKEVNVSGLTKIHLFSIINEQLKQEKWTLKETPYKIFFPIKHILMSELQIDPFARYLRTKSCSLTVSLFIDNPKVMILESIVKFPFCDKDFENPFISKKEMEFIKEISKDSFSWNLVNSTKNMMLYTSSTPFLPDSKAFKNSKSFKIESVLPYSFEKVVNLFFSTENMLKMDKDLIKINFKKKHWSDELKLNYPDEDIQNPFYYIEGESFFRLNQKPFNTPRKTVDIYNMEYDEEEDTLTFFRRPYLASFKGMDVYLDEKMNFESFPTVNGKEIHNVDGYVMSIMDMVKIKIIDPYTTRYSFVRSTQNLNSHF